MKHIERAAWSIEGNEDIHRASGHARKAQPADFVLLVLLFVTLAAMVLRG